MLFSWIDFAIGQLSAAGLPPIDVTRAVSRAIAQPITPGEPSTIVEALIGAGMIAGYLVLTRRWRTGRGLQKTFAPQGRITKRKAA